MHITILVLNICFFICLFMLTLLFPTICSLFFLDKYMIQKKSNHLTKSWITSQNRCQTYLLHETPFYWLCWQCLQTNNISAWTNQQCLEQTHVYCMKFGPVIKLFIYTITFLSWNVLTKKPSNVVIVQPVPNSSHSLKRGYTHPCILSCSITSVQTLTYQHNKIQYVNQFWRLSLLQELISPQTHWRLQQRPTTNQL